MAPDSLEMEKKFCNHIVKFHAYVFEKVGRYAPACLVGSVQVTFLSSDLLTAGKLLAWVLIFRPSLLKRLLLLVVLYSVVHI